MATVGIQHDNQSGTQFLSVMDELRRLVDTAGGEVVKVFSQKRHRFDPAFLIGKGKIEQMATELRHSGIKTIIFDDDLTAAQQKNIEKILKSKIIDRTRLILDIFAQRARTKEGQLQIELAQLNYLVPRLTGAWRGFSQQMGGIGMRGPGERKIEVERRYVRERIKRLKKDIEDIRDHRQRARSTREKVPLPQVALVGYTNVGKSTLLNALTHHQDDVYADDLLFSTLDPTTRRVKLPGGRTVLFTDTVGFIQKLPHDLVAAFRATLEEAANSSLLIHLVDVSAEDYADQQRTVVEVIQSLNADHIPMITVYNKIDRLTASQIESLERKGGLTISGKSGEGLSTLLTAIEKKLDEHLIEGSLHVSHQQRNFLSDIYRTAHILSETTTQEGTQLRVRMDASNYKRLTQLLSSSPSHHE